MDETVSGGSTQVIRLASAGTLIALFETGPAFVIDAASFGVAAPAVFLVRGGRRAAPSGEHAERGPRVVSSAGEDIRAALAGFACGVPAHMDRERIA